MSTIHTAFRALSLFALLVAVAAAATATPAWADDSPPTKFFGGAAREIKSSLESGNGWCVVTARANVRLLSDPNAGAVECLKYRVVTAYNFGRDSNQEDFIVLTYSAETPWISAEFNTPKSSGPSLTAAKAANEAVALLDTLVAQLEPAINGDENAEVRAAGVILLNLMRNQRAALVDLIAKDIRAVDMAR